MEVLIVKDLLSFWPIILQDDAYGLTDIYYHDLCFIWKI